MPFADGGRALGDLQVPPHGHYLAWTLSAGVVGVCFCSVLCLGVLSDVPLLCTSTIFHQLFFFFVFLSHTLETLLESLSQASSATLGVL